MKKNNIILTIITALVVGALGFYGGMQYQKSQRGNFSGNFIQRGTGQMGQSRSNVQGAPDGQTNRAGRPVSGEITNIDDNTITIKAQDGSSKIVIYSDSTNINKTSEGSEADLKVGENIMVIGAESTDGAVTAQNISVGNIMVQKTDNPN